MPEVKEEDVSRETQDKLKTYAALLSKWNQQINLIGRSTEQEIWNRHIEDSAQLQSYIPNNAMSLMDIGTGAGLPGMILAIIFPDLVVDLVEANQKKCAFLENAKHQLHLNKVSIHPKRIEAIQGKQYDVITSRALAPLKKLCSYSEPFLKENTLCIFPKGSTVKTEIEELKECWVGDITLHPSTTHQQSSIVLLRNIRKK